MTHGHNSKLEHANVTGVFDTQEEAEEAVLELRNAGFPDSRIGFFARNQMGLITDYLGRGHTLAGAVIGAIAGAALGVLAAQYAMDTRATPFAPLMMAGEMGMLLTGALCGAILLGMTGALIGWGIPHADAVHYGNEVDTGKFLVAVDAGDRRNLAWTAIYRHGGHDTPPPIPGM
jgi:hypothetical protein